MSRSGSLCLLLHSHMPYVEGFGTWPFGEEWLFEAVASSYVPLLEVLDGVAVTVTVTPVLADQFEVMRHGEAGDRFLSFLREVRALVHDEDARELEAAGDGELAAELRRAAADYERADAFFESHGRDLLGAFARLDGVELWTSA
ncbi:MAG: 1,4-alpha-glucan branching enzyme, partial [Thermoleophilaceae bacterium]|nr:1,4-alpha-glucan branching enzyme [Thermoleophilaceae bacterium]